MVETLDEILRKALQYKGSDVFVVPGSQIMTKASGKMIPISEERALPNDISILVDRAYEQGMRIVLNPSPYDGRLAEVDFAKLSWVLVNEVEAEQMTGTQDPEQAWEIMHRCWPDLSAVITLGSRGSAAFARGGNGTETARQEAVKVQAVDTTAAGDTFTGYFIAGLAAGKPLRECMAQASLAAAVSVTRPGAADSIPRAEELEKGETGR